MKDYNRFENALFIQTGASNGRGVSKTLAKAYDEVAAERYADHERITTEQADELFLGRDQIKRKFAGTDQQNTDPAVQLILHQLCHLARISTDDWARSDDGKILGFHYETAYSDCVARASDSVLEACGIARRNYPRQVCPACSAERGEECRGPRSSSTIPLMVDCRVPRMVEPQLSETIARISATKITPSSGS